MGIFSKSESGGTTPRADVDLKQGELVIESGMDKSDVVKDSSGELLALSEVQRALSEIESVEDIKEIRDKAEAVRKYVESAGLGLEMQNKAAELKLRAERKAGEMLAEMKLHGGDRRSDEQDDRLRLTDLGISKDQSSRWQLLARVPAKLFDDFVAQFTVHQVELTTAEALRYARTLKARKESAATGGQPEQTDSGLLQWPELVEAGIKFGCIYASLDHGSGNAMPLEKLRQLEIESIAAEQSHCHLWTSHEQSNHAESILRAWGFEPRDIFIWVKPKRGPGEYWRRAHELLMLGVRGDCPFLDKSIHSWIQANRPRHGGKPSKVRELIETVSPGPYLELFADRPARGWQCCRVSDDS
ncbi:MT-A70 family methyltransferase [Novipirellula aureliae]|nr:MT-A70 family methyltransferase [Novipirellula aureliae]